MIEIQNNISMKHYNTFHIDAKAKFLVEIKNADEFVELLKSEIWNQYPHLFLGGGANILFTHDYPGIIIKVALNGKSIVREDDDTIYIKAGSGESWPAFVNRCVEHGYQGLENLALIPGTIGGSAVGNIGAYDTEAKDVVDEVEYIRLTDGQINRLTNSECKFSYRESIFKHELADKVFITNVIFKLKKTNDIRSLQKTVADIIAMRQKKLPDPAQVGTAGSFFKNPVITEDEYNKLLIKYPNLIGNKINENEIKLAAGQLIELCGLKGYKMGNAGVSSAHALILINLGNATGAEILNLANYIISQVQKNFGITLEPEVRLVPGPEVPSS